MAIWRRNQSTAQRSFSTFRKEFIISSLANPEDFDSYEARMIRYQILWSMYENTAYDNLHTWAKEYKKQFGIYIYARNLFNPSTRLANFYQTHIWGGRLDPLAGDGTAIPSAIPILTENENIREPIAQIWADSNWAIKKDILPLHGSSMGDAFIRVVDSKEHKKVYKEIIHPTRVKGITKDPFGNVKGYVLEWERYHPEDSKKGFVTYTEIADRDEDNNVRFTTLLNGKPFAWNGDVPSWTVEWGFIPFAHVLHNDVGFGYGWAEGQQAFSRIHDVDDVASKTTDQIRKITEGALLFSGSSKPEVVPTAAAATPSRDRLQPGRETMASFYTGEKGDAKPLAADIDIMADVGYIEQKNAELQKIYPELRLDEEEIINIPSGRALRILQQPAKNKTIARRMSYYKAEIVTNAMALSIGAMANYPGYEQLPDDGFKQGEFNHTIDEREVFSLDPLDKLEIESAAWDIVIKAASIGVEIEAALRDLGWSDERIKNVKRINDRAMTREERRAALEEARNQEDPVDEDAEEINE
jgi:hypothetical protein